MYASAFFANLGLGRHRRHLPPPVRVRHGQPVRRPGRTDKGVVVGEDGQPAVRDGVKHPLDSFDERINDGFYCASSLKGVQAVVEDPAAALGEP